MYQLISILQLRNVVTFLFLRNYGKNSIKRFVLFRYEQMFWFKVRLFTCSKKNSQEFMFPKQWGNVKHKMTIFWHRPKIFPIFQKLENWVLKLVFFWPKNRGFPLITKKPFIRSFSNFERRCAIKLRVWWCITL